MKRRSQLELDLTVPARWGGSREGAGRKAALRPRVWHRERAPFPARFPGLVTLRVRREIPSLRTADLVREFECSLRVLSKRADFRVVHFSLQHDHAHLLVEAEGAAALSNGMKSLAARLARAVNRVFGRRGAVLDGRFHHRALTTPREVRNALAYVLNNARKHARGRALQHAGERERAGGADDLWIDPASSGRWFAGWAIGRAGGDDRPAVARPQTWLLRAGWMRHGLIRCDEIPGGVRRVR